MTILSRIATLAISSCLLAVPAFAEAPPDKPPMAAQLLAMSLEDLGKIKVSTPSGTPATLQKAAAVTTVITSTDIKAMGTNDLMVVLETVPGLHVGMTEQADLRKPMIRGITSSFNPQTVVLVNGIPLTSNFTGNRSHLLGSMPLKAVKRIEVIRGPGSALYGADAYAGVINIITKTPADLLRNSDTPVALAGVSAASFDTQGAWIQTASAYNGLHAGVSIEYEKTDGHRETIDHDAQTNFDAVFGTSASLAPGPTNNGLKETLLRMELSGNQWRFRSGYQHRTDIETGAGVAFALDPKGRYSGYRFNADYSHFFEAFDQALAIESRVSFLRTTQIVEETLWLYPPEAFGGAFPDGFSGNPGYREDQARYDLSGTYKHIDNHLLRMGVGIYWGDMYEVMLSRNFMTLPNGRPGPRPGGMVDVSDTAESYLPEAQRSSHYLLAQDEWQITPELHLTTGVRFDDYSDFGTTTNPRLALVWDTTSALTTKFLVGRAFRSPSYAELYTNSSVQIGNPDLGPETIDTWEIAFSVRPSSRLNYGVNLFHYKIDDFITAIPRSGSNRLFFSNVGDRTGNGGEVEFSWLLHRQVRLLGNYSYAHALDDSTDAQVGEFPAHQVYTRLEWLVLPDWKLSPQLNYVGEQQRIASDSRAPLDAYTTFDITLRQLFSPTLEWSISAHNLFNANVREPSPYGNPTTIPGDFPRAGRSLKADVSVNF